MTRQETLSESPFTFEDGYIQHPFVKDDCIEYREYQKQIAEACLSKSSLVALPTAAGKTIVAALVAAERLYSAGGRILFLAPNKPLVTQQAEEFDRVLDLLDSDIRELTGEVRPDKREEIWKGKDHRIIFATPQIIENDILADRLNLTDITYIVFDECHRATGGYAYTFIAEQYQRQQEAERHLVTGLSASPGSSEEDILKLCDTLGVSNVEILSEGDDLLSEHVTSPDITPRWVEIDDEIHEMREKLQQASKDCYKELKQREYLESARKDLSFGELQKARGQIQKDLDKGDSDAYEAMSIHAEAMKLYQAVKIIDTQGVSALIKYLNRQKEEASGSDASKAVKRMMRRSEVKEAFSLAEEYDSVHPKKTVLQTYMIDVVVEDGQLIVFTEYTDTADDLVEFINERHDKIQAQKFVGQQDMSQSRQQEILDQFRTGEFDVLVATSVGEEGLDIPATEMVIFYEPVSSSLRTIQRRGRTARDGEGKVVILIGEGTRDEAMYYASKKREDSMKSELSELASREESIQQLIRTQLEPEEDENEEEQASLDGFTEDEIDVDEEAVKEDTENVESKEIEFESNELSVIADSRETKSNVVRELYEMDDISVDTETLDVGDFIVGTETVVERKESSDLVSTITGDRDIFEQITNMVNSYDRAILLIEGSTEELYSKGVHPNAIRGLLDTIADKFGVDIYYSTGQEDSARWLSTFAENAQEESDTEVNPHGNKQTQSLTDQQEYVVSSMADVGPVTARNLLNEFETVRGVFNASESELQAVEGVGPKLADKIQNVLTSEYDSN